MAKRRKMKKKPASKALARRRRSPSAVVRRKGRGRIARRRSNAMNPANAEGFLNIGVAMGAGAAVGWGVEYLVKMARTKAEQLAKDGITSADPAPLFGSNRTVNGAIFAAAGVGLAMFGPQLFGAKSARVAELAGCAMVGAAGAIIVRDRLEKAEIDKLNAGLSGPVYTWDDRSNLSGPVREQPRMTYQPARSSLGAYATANVHPRFQ